ncbi:MAG: glycosyltransferase [Lachnospiraceae bacterium]|nr:glycosyltransferase [Lachnospiraceae bacterium]
MKKKIFWNKFWIFWTLLLTFVYLVWRAVRTVPYEKPVTSYIFWTLLFVAELIGLLEMAVHFYNMYDYGANKLPKPNMDAKRFPDVDVLIPTVNEPCKLLEKTVKACVQMEYARKERVHVYVLDDGNRKEVEQMAKRLGVNYLARQEHEFAKAGNLNYALEHSDSPLVVVFDADMIPEPQFLMETVPYFATNIELLNNKTSKGIRKEYKKENMIGFVQTPQSFYQPDLFQQNLYSEDHIPNEQDYFYRVVQLSKIKSNSVIFGGTNAVLWREALESIGGFVTGVVTEDFATGIEIEKKGYKGIAIPEILAGGLPALTFRDLIRQRRRWAKGCIQSGKVAHILLSRELKLVQKINYFTSISYWYNSCKRLMYFFAPVAFALFGIVAVECRIEEVLMFWLPMYLCTKICVHRFSGNVRNTKWTNIYENTFFPYLLIPVLIESIGFKQKEFKVTRKDTVSKKNSNLLYMLPFLLGIVVSVWSLINIFNLSIRENTYTYSVLIFWLLINLYYMVMSLLVAWGRPVITDIDNQKTLPHKLKRVYIDEGLVAFVKHLVGI